MIESNTTTNKISTSCRSNQFISGLSSITLFCKDIYTKLQQKKMFFFTLVMLFVLIIITTYSSQHVFLSSNQITVPKYRVAYCMTGVPRTLYKEEVYAAYRRQTLNILPGDLFVVLQLMDKTERIHAGTIISCSPPERYATALKFLSPRKTEWIAVHDDLGVKDMRGGYAKWQRCLEHIEEAEKQDGEKYDFIVRSRPDLYFAKDLPSASILPKDRILISPYYECLQDIPEGYNQTWSINETRCDAKNSAISDLFAIIPRALANPYMRLAYTPNLLLQVCGAQANYPEYAIRAALYKANITVELWSFVVKIMRSAEFCHATEWNRFNSWC